MSLQEAAEQIPDFLMVVNNKDVGCGFHDI